MEEKYLYCNSFEFILQQENLKTVGGTVMGGIRLHCLNLGHTGYFRLHFRSFCYLNFYNNMQAMLHNTAELNVKWRLE